MNEPNCNTPLDSTPTADFMPDFMPDPMPDFMPQVVLSDQPDQSDQFLNRLVDTLTSSPVEATDGSRAFHGCFVPSDTPLIPPLDTAPIAIKLDFIVARAFYFNPRISIMNIGGEDMLYDGRTFYSIRETTYRIIIRLSQMTLTPAEQRLSFARLLDIAPRAKPSLIEISPTLMWDKDTATLIDMTDHTSNRAEEQAEEENQGEKENDN